MISERRLLTKDGGGSPAAEPNYQSLITALLVPPEAECANYGAKGEVRMDGIRGSGRILTDGQRGLLRRVYFPLLPALLVHREIPIPEMAAPQD